jgi:hypothetical protein
MNAASLLAIGWNPEIRGILTVIIAVFALCGSVYLALGTNLGARLGFLVSLTGLMGWMAMMGIIWWIYGIGLTGQAPTWQLDAAIVRDGNLAPLNLEGVKTGDDLAKNDWELLPEEDPGRGQAIASALEILTAQEIDSGELVAGNVYHTGGEHGPLLFGKAELDFIAFFRKPAYTLVELQGRVATVAEPGRAPAVPVADPAQPKQYVKMIRDYGSLRRPAQYLTLGGGLVFLLLCWMLHRRDQIWAKNTGKSLVPVGA